MAVLENLPSKTLGFLHVFSSENHFFNTLLGYDRLGAIDALL
jgi:hypothetical protein